MSGRSPGRSATRAVILAGFVLAGVGRPVTPVLALMTETETVPATFTAEVLDPPTNLDVTGPLLTKTLTWTATVDTRATGYLVFRSTTSGGPYTQIATITPRTTTTYVDVVIGLGTRYYVLQSYYGSWTSVNSNQDSA
jgi:hypothetical protein